MKCKHEIMAKKEGKSDWINVGGDSLIMNFGGVDQFGAYDIEIFKCLQCGDTVPVKNYDKYK